MDRFVHSAKQRDLSQRLEARKGIFELYGDNWKTSVFGKRNVISGKKSSFSHFFAVGNILEKSHKPPEAIKKHETPLHLAYRALRQNSYEVDLQIYQFNCESFQILTLFRRREPRSRRNSWTIFWGKDSSESF